MIKGMNPALAGSTILVTGAAGFLGSALIRRLAPVSCTVRRLARQPGEFPTIPMDTLAKFEDIVGDVRVAATWRQALRDVDVVFHLAGQTSVYTAQENPDADLDANVRSVLHLIEISRELRRCPVIVAAGTATTVGLTTDSCPVDESTPDRPITLYDVHKLMAEQYLETATRQSFVAATTLRLANVYGPGPRGSSRERGFLNAMVARAVGQKPLTMYGTGSCVRDYVYVDDVADAFVMAAESIESLQGHHFLIGSGQGISIGSALDLVADLVARRTGTRVPVESIDPPSGLSPIENRSFVANTARFRTATGWNPMFTLEQGINRTIDVACSANVTSPA